MLLLVGMTALNSIPGGGVTKNLIYCFFMLINSDHLRTKSDYVFFSITNFFYVDIVE